MKILKKRTTLKKLCERLETRRHGRGYYHLTIWSTLCKMLEPVQPPDGGSPCKMLQLGAAVRMNDEFDKRCGDGVYYTCFSFGPAENISMWTNYGIPNREAVRIRFPRSVMTKWLTDFNAGKIPVYGVDEEHKLHVLEERPVAKLVDVAYWSKYLGKTNKAKIDDPNSGVLKYFENTHIITEPKDWRQQMLDGKLRDVAFMFKETGWSYECETRLVLVFKHGHADKYFRMAVPFEKPYASLEKDFACAVTQGPWYSPECEETRRLAGGHSLAQAQPSVYQGKLNMRSVCQTCQQKNREKCNCPFKNQR